MSADKTWKVNGPCPFLTCTEMSPHEHAVCPDCDAVRYGNPFSCPTCNAVLNAELAMHGREPIGLAGDTP